MNTIAICSLLHESADDGSLTRRFRGEPVLHWTMRRLALSTRIDRVVVLAWDDQLEALTDLDVTARACGPRRPLPLLDAVTAAQRWADGWRGGLLQTCWFDKGFVAAFVRDAMADDLADVAVLIDPAAGLVDASILDDLVAAAETGTRELYFTQAAPGLGGVLIRRGLVDHLAATGAMPGRVVHYLPDAPALDPITSDACVAVPMEISRVADRFTLDSERQIRRLEQATIPLNGTLISTRAAGVVRRVTAAAEPVAFPRDIVLELTTRRATMPTFNIASQTPIHRADLTAADFDRFVSQIGHADDVRVTLAGVGDPLLHADAIDWINALSKVASVAVETDLLDLSPDVITRLADAGADVIAVHLPATTPGVYAEVMGVDRMAAVLENVRRLLEARQRRLSGVPIFVPLFTKTLANFDEMETWYDTWLRAVGTATIVGPSTFGGRIAGVRVADMTPPVRRPCERLRDRITVLSDGAIVACEEDPLAENPLGRLAETTLVDAWNGPFAGLRQRHVSLTQLPTVCTRCTEWHRP